MKTQHLVKTFGLVLIAGSSMNCTSEELGPSTCKEAKSAYGVVVDGSQTLYVDGDKSMPWSAYCAGMASDEPKEFLELPQYSAGGGPVNYSEFFEYPLTSANFAEEGPSSFQVRTQFQRVRIDPKTLALDIANTAFTRADMTPTGTNHASGALDLVVGSVPFGTAMQCGPLPPVSGIRTAQASIDFTGLPFELAETELCKGIGNNTAFADPTAPTKAFTFQAEGSTTSDLKLTCGRASVRCLPDPAVNGQVGGQQTIQLRYVSGTTGFGF